MIADWWLFQPFESFSLGTVGLWYVVSTVLMLFVSSVYQQFAEIDNPIPDSMTVREAAIAVILVMPVLEELLFRIAPVWGGASALTVIGLSLVWALIHGKRFPIILCVVPFYVKLALGGFLIHLIVVHILHNGWLFGFAYVFGSIGDDDGKSTEEVLKILEDRYDADIMLTVGDETYESVDEMPSSVLRRIEASDVSFDESDE